MSFDVQGAARKYISQELLYKLSVYLDENEGSIHAAYSRVLPIYLQSIMLEPGSIGFGRKEVYTIISDYNNFKMLDSFNTIFRDGGRILREGVSQSRKLLGDNLRKLVSSIAVLDGLREETILILFGITSSVVTGILSKGITCYSLCEKEFWIILNSQKKQIASIESPGTKLILGAIERSCTGGWPLLSEYCAN